MVKSLMNIVPIWLLTYLQSTYRQFVVWNWYSLISSTSICRLYAYPKQKMLRNSQTNKGCHVVTSILDVFDAREITGLLIFANGLPHKRHSGHFNLSKANANICKIVILIPIIIRKRKPCLASISGRISFVLKISPSIHTYRYIIHHLNVFCMPKYTFYSGTDSKQFESWQLSKIIYKIV